jgi:transcriptional regulator with XRE-family HTH domain
VAKTPKTLDPIQVKTNMGAALRRLREHAPLTQEELGNRMHMDYRYIRRIERGERGVSWYTVMRFLNGLDATPQDLADELSKHS